MTYNQQKTLLGLANQGKINWTSTTAGQTRTLDTLVGLGFATFDMASRFWTITDKGWNEAQKARIKIVERAKRIMGGVS